MQRKMTVEEVARAVYEVHAIYAKTIGETYDAWEDAPDWKRSPLLANVRRLIRNPHLTQEILHELWCAEKERDGWEHGPEKDAEKRTHPLMVPWREVPPYQQTKDDILFNVVAALRSAAQLPEEDGGADGGTAPGGGAGCLNCAAPSNGQRIGHQFAAPVTINHLTAYHY